MCALPIFSAIFYLESYLPLLIWMFLLNTVISSLMPLGEAATVHALYKNNDFDRRYGRLRLWGSIGFIVAVIGVGYALDGWPPRAVLSIVLLLMLCILACCWLTPEAKSAPHETDTQPLWDILKRPEVMALIVAAALMAVAHGPYYTFYTIYLVDHGYSKSMAGWLWALGVICEIGIFVWMPHLYRAFTLRQILLGSFALAVDRKSTRLNSSHT